MIGEIQATFSAAGNIDLTHGRNYITIQAADMDDFLAWVKSNRSQAI